MQTHTVTLPSDYLSRSVRNNYSNVPRSLTRELIQNSVDAGATEIDITFSTNEDGDTVYTCKDNGHGMSQERMVEALLTFGGSFKNAGAVGGFGEAKILLLLCMKHFTIHSLNTYVTGSGLQYHIHENATHFAGTIISGVTPFTSYKEETYAHNAINFIKTCRLPDVKVTVNGNVVETDKGSENEQSMIIEGVPVTYQIHEYRSGFEVYHNGVPMFSNYCGTLAENKLLVKVHIPNSLDYLLSSRDALKEDKTFIYDKIRSHICKRVDNITAGLATKSYIRYVSYGNRVFVPDSAYPKLKEFLTGTLDLDFFVVEEGYAGKYVKVDSATQAYLNKGGDSTEWFGLLGDYLRHTYKLIVFSDTVPHQYLLKNISKALLSKLAYFRACLDIGTNYYGEVGFILDDNCDGFYTYTSGTSNIYVHPRVLASKVSTLHTAVHEKAHYNGYEHHDSKFAHELGEIFSKLVLNPKEMKQIRTRTAYYLDQWMEVK